MSFITQRGANGPLSLTAAAGGVSGAFQSSTDVSLQTLVGTKWDLSDGREVVLVYSSSATTVVPGYFYQNAALIAGEQGVTLASFTAASVNGNVPASVTLTSGSTTAVTAGQFAGGYLVVQSGTGIGQTLRISNNTAATAGNSYLYTIVLEDSPVTALSTSSVVNVIPQVGYNVVISPAAASLTNTVVGTSLYGFPASNYGFLVSRGNVGMVAVSAGVAAGSSVSVGAAGAAVILSAGLPVLGHNGAALAASDANIVEVNI